MQVLLAKANQRIGVHMRLKNLIPTEANLQLYKAAILLHLTYCHITWHFCKASDRRKLDHIQEGGIMVYKDKLSSYEKLLAKADIPSLYKDDYRTLLSSCIRLSINYCHRDFVIFFQLDSGSYHLRKREFVH